MVPWRAILAALGCAVFGYACGGEVLVEDGWTSSGTGGSTHAGGSGGQGQPTFTPGGGSPEGCGTLACGEVATSSGCMGCALDAGACPEEHAACLTELECLDFEQCVNGCGSLECVNHCHAVHSDGAKAYEKLQYCLACLAADRCDLACGLSCTVK